jgi:hypothetical protein
MNNNRLGCLSASAVLATIITLVLIGGYALFFGGRLFTPGELNAQAGESLGGVSSHGAIGNDCGQCHPAPWETTTLGDRCVKCHTGISLELADTASMHGIMMKDRTLSCQSCHLEHRGTNASLTDMKTGTFPHEPTGYSLASHRKRSDGQSFVCSDCHGDDITSFNPLICSECHQQTDSSFLAAHAQAYGDDCLGCHDGRETISVNFNHNSTTFKLDGKHQAVTCEKCHRDARVKADFANLSVECVSCHLEDDEHNGEFGKNCAVCHSTTAWEPSTFDHNLSGFKLEGEHAEAECKECHINQIYKGTPSECFACHEKDDEHQGKFGPNCGTCHSTSAWEPATFDHNLSAFKLDGAHIQVECEKCHINQVYKGTSTVCSDCHQDPAYHAGMFPGQACSECHTTNAWRPAPYNGSHTFPMDHGEKNNSCADCHQPTLKEWTCYSCHDRGEIASEHQEEGISDYGDCLRCHPTGREEEGEGGND